MQVQVARWGNSLGVRIPKHIAERAGLREGVRVEIEAEADRIDRELGHPTTRPESDQRWPSAALLATAAGIEIGPDEIARLGHIGPCLTRTLMRVR